jgi:hypothetical protein
VLDGSGATVYQLQDDLPPDVRAMSATPDGELVVAWTSNFFDSTGYYSRHGWLSEFAADGSEVGSPVPLTDRIEGNLVPGSVSASPGGSAFVAYSRHPPDPFWDEDPIGVELQRYCSTNDPTCALCPDHDDDIDTDSDLIPDGCDPCSNAAGAQDGIVAKASVASGIEPRDMRAVFDQTFLLPAGSSFGTLDVLANGARLRIESVRGQAMFDAALPGGAYAGSGTRGWTATPTKLKYTDRTESLIDGVKRVLIVDQANKQPGRVRVKARAGGGKFGMWDSMLPMTAIVALGDETAAAAGECGEFSFVADQCEIVGYRAGRCLGRAE